MTEVGKIRLAIDKTAIIWGLTSDVEKLKEDVEELRAEIAELRRAQRPTKKSEGSE